MHWYKEMFSSTCCVLGFISKGTANMEQSKALDVLTIPYIFLCFFPLIRRLSFYLILDVSNPFSHTLMLLVFLFLAGKKRPAWDYKGRLEDMEGLMLKSKSFMENMTKTIGDNQDRIGFLESLNKQLEGTVQVKHQQTEEVTFLLALFLDFLLFFFSSNR